MESSPLLRALLVFSDASEISALRGTLKNGDLALDTGQATSVAEALTALITAPFDFVLSSVHLSDGGARDIALQYPIVSCVAVGSSQDQEALDEALEGGAVDYILTDSPDWRSTVGPYLYRLWRIRRRLAVELSHVSKRYEDLVEALPDIVYELDVNGNFTFVNQAVKILGYTPAELMGKHFGTILFEEDVPHVSRDQVLPLYLKNRTGARNAPKLFDERRGVDRKTENLELRIKRKTSNVSQGKEVIASVISYGEIAAAGTYRTLGNVKEKVFVGTVGIIRDITLRRKSEDMLRKMYQAVDQSPVAVAILDRDLVIEYVNPTFFSLTGSGPERALGTKIKEYLGDGQPIYEDMVTSIKTGLDWKGEFLCPREGGAPFWCSIILSTIRSPGGSITHYLCLMEDISQKRTLDDLLLQAKEAAEDASRAKSEFLANISHELRTPLGGILSLSEVLKKENPRADQIERLEGIQASANGLLNILNDLLDLSKIEARSIELHFEDFDLKEGLEIALSPFKAMAEEKGLRFDFIIEDSGYPRIQTDRGRFIQVVTNLVSNAIKFTEQGSIYIHCAIRAKDDMPALFVSVKDTGIGISGTDQQKLFKHFSQIDGSLSKKYPGTGLGLAISKELVQKMGGDITVESAPGVGSTFSFFIPISTSGPNKPEDAEGSTFARQKLSILVAEDNPVNRDYLRYFLEKAGHQVELVQDGYEALRALESGDFDAILMDVQMPGMDGIATVSTIRSYTGIEFDPNIPIIALTAFSQDEMMDRSQLADFDGHVGKPVNITKLVTLIDQVVLNKEYFDINKIRKQFSASEEEFRRLLMITAQDLPKRMEKFEQAHGSGNWTEAVEVLHGMVSIFSPLGAIRAQQLAKRYRKMATEGNINGIGASADALLREIRGIKRQVQHTLGEL